MERRTCKLCFRRFTNGRALGGHMRSHFVTSGAASAKSFISDDSNSSTSLREAQETNEMGYGLRENPRKSFRLVDPEFSSSFPALESVSTVVDSQSETESTTLTRIRRRRAKRRLRTISSSTPRMELREAEEELREAELLSSVSETTPEEDVALCLVMLSRDSWSKGEHEEAEVDLVSRFFPPVARVKRRYRCDMCGKVFWSYQALGGHRANHKKTRSSAPTAESSKVNGDKDGVAKATHECPFCFRVFSSGQALGGHKRSHFSSTAPITTTPPVPSSTTASPVSSKLNKSLFDLNLPAPLDNEADLSAFSGS
ncbi:hypothetical protein HPP92_007199 [Vanilla planifolia]|uniref:C2H2-type domain-containing protein n=1 Tax=Vanilla planifolia TaxID=51239 RepID=A0A835RCM0_VANPL|nr:hypothetical protein HPP92_007425 [Vanilla planifolia]KAG0490336.1 hypothetical protein HPP92_007199 [Vanilla planifolia]